MYGYNRPRAEVDEFMLRLYSATRHWFIDRPNARIRTFDDPMTVCSGIEVYERIHGRILTTSARVSHWMADRPIAELDGLIEHMARDLRFKWQEALVHG